MRLLRPLIARPLLALLGVALTVGSCGRELTGPAGGRSAVIALQPTFAALRLDGSGQVLSVGAVVPFTRVRVVLRRTTGEAALDTIVTFPADADSVALAFTVTLSANAPVDGESLGASMRYLNAAGDTVFAAGPVAVLARAPSNTAPVEPVVIPLTYVGPGKDAASLTIAPDSAVGLRGQSVTFSAVARDAQGTTLPNTPVAYTSTDTGLVRVDLATGVATLVGVRGVAGVIAQTLTGPRDTARVRILPTPTGIAVQSGNAQEVRQGGVFAQPLRVRVVAADGLPVAGTAVDFAVTAGRGTVSPVRATTDTAGVAQATWTAGDTAMVGTVVATVVGQSSLTATFTGTQLSTGPALLQYSVPPRRGVPAGDSLGPVVVRVLNRFNEPVTNFRGTMSLALTGGTSGAQLVGTTAVTVDSGSAAGTFRDLTVTRAGSGYRLVATLQTPALTVTSDTFSVAAARPATILLITGGGQATIPGTPFPDSVRVRVRDRFNFDVPAAPVQFAVTGGGGSVSPTTATTDGSGFAATRWIAGPTGGQTLSVTVGGLSLAVFASVPNAVALTSGGGQGALFGTPFPQPVVFRVATDSGRALAGIPVAFSVTGGGTVSQVRDTADANGVVSVIWTAGSVAGLAELTATIPGTTISAVASGEQASPAPTSVELLGAPAQLTAGDTMPTLTVRVLNGLRAPVPGYTGGVRIGLAGGTSGAQLLGTTLRPASAGVATFPGLTIDRAGRGYRLVASVDPAQPGLSTNSDTITVSPAPPTAVSLVSGGGQSAPSGGTLADSIVVRVTDRFGLGVVGATVRFSVVTGDGTVSAASVVTAGEPTPGRAAVRWAVGLPGPQQLRVQVTGVPDLLVSATGLESLGPPVLVIGQGDGLALKVGQKQRIDVYLTAPMPSALPVTLSTRDPEIASFGLPSVTYQNPAGNTLASTDLIPAAVGTTVVRVTSAIGSDSIVVVVDSALVGFRNGGTFPISTVSGDTIRTQVVLDAPAPFPGVTVTVTSPDPARLRVAPGSGRGLTEPVCAYCTAVRATDPADTVALLAPPGATATIQIAEGQFAGEVVLLPKDSLVVPGSPSLVNLTVSAAGRRGSVKGVVISAPVTTTALWTQRLPVGHLVRGAIQLPAPLRRGLTLRVRSADPTILVPIDTAPYIGPLEQFSDELRLARAVGVGVGRLIVDAPGFRPDTVQVTVTARALVLESWSTAVKVDEEFFAIVRLGTRPDGTFGFAADAPVADSVPITLQVSDAKVVEALRPTVLAAGVPSVQVGLRAIAAGTVSIIASAPGYGSDTLVITVGRATPTLTIGPQLSRGLVGEATIRWADVTSPIGSPVEFQLTSNDTSVVRVLTPTVYVTAGAEGTTARVEAVGVGTATLALSANGYPSASQSVTVVQTAKIAALVVPSQAVLDTATIPVALYLDGEAASRLTFRLRSTDAAVASVVDSLVTIPAGGVMAEPRIRVGGVGVARFILSRDGVDIDTSATLNASLAPISVSGPGGVIGGVVPIGPGVRLPLVAFLTPGLATNLAISVRGTLGTTLVDSAWTPMAPAEGRPFLLVGAASLDPAGADTVTITRPLAVPVQFILRPGSLRATPLVSPVVVGQAAEVSAALRLAGTEWSFTLVETQVARRFRLISLDTTRLLVERDTVGFVAGGYAAASLGRVRALGVGTVRLLLQPVTPVAGIGTDTIDVVIDRARLAMPIGYGAALTLGMQQRTYAEEVYVERNAPSPRPLWVRLRSSARAVATVPDSVLIPGGAAYVHFPVTAGDTVGTVRITATAPNHAEAGFDVIVGRTQLQPVTPFSPYGALTTGGRTTVDVFVLGLSDGYGASPAARSPDEPLLEAQSVFGFARDMTRPIPFRLTFDDTLVVSAVRDATGALRDTATIAAGAYQVRLPGVIGRTAGRTRARLTDRRDTTVFARTLTAEGVVDVERAVMQVQIPPPLARIQVPFLGVTPGSRMPVLTSTASADSITVQVTSRTARVGLPTQPLVLVRTDSSWYGHLTPLGLRGLALGVDTLVVTAPGHRPDTAVVEVVAGGIGVAEQTPPLPASVTVGDSTLLTVSLYDPAGYAFEVIAPVQLNIATTAAVVATRAGVTVTSVTLQPGQSRASIWLKGVSVGTTTITLSTPNFAPYQATLSVRAP